MLQQLLAECSVGARSELVQRAVRRKPLQLLGYEAGRLRRLIVLQQRVRIVVDELHLARIADQRRLVSGDRGSELTRLREYLPRHALDHRMRGRDLLKCGELGLCALEILGPEQRSNES